MGYYRKYKRFHKHIPIIMTDMEFNQDYEDQQREADEIINDFESW